MTLEISFLAAKGGSICVFESFRKFIDTITINVDLNLRQRRIFALILVAPFVHEDKLRL